MRDIYGWKALQMLDHRHSLACATQMASSAFAAPAPGPRGSFSGGNVLFDRDEAVGTDRDRVDATVDQEISEFGMIAWRLTTQADRGAGLVGLFDNAADHPFHRFVLFIEQFREVS